MKYIANNKDLMIIGYPQSLLTQDSVEVAKEFIKSKISIISPSDFLKISDKDNYQYFPGFGLDLCERQSIIDVLDSLNLDVVSYIHDTAQVHKSSKIGRGVIIMNCSTVMQNVKIGDYCIIEMFCLIAHDSSVGSNCIIHSGSMIAGATSVGNNCTFNFKSSVLNRLSICNDVIVGAASTITKDITNAGTYVGTPARKIK
jgi:sugar O-acyltransferase (sialic acid O-acetyltransferase NeuD family)